MLPWRGWQSTVLMSVTVLYFSLVDYFSLNIKKRHLNFILMSLYYPIPSMYSVTPAKMACLKKKCRSILPQSYKRRPAQTVPSAD